MVFQYMHNICCDQIGPISISPASDIYLALGAFESLCNNYFEILNSELLTSDFYCAIEYEQYSFFVIFFLRPRLTYHRLALTSLVPKDGLEFLILPINSPSLTVAGITTTLRLKDSTMYILDKVSTN